MLSDNIRHILPSLSVGSMREKKRNISKHRTTAFDKWHSIFLFFALPELAVPIKMCYNSTFVRWMKCISQTLLIKALCFCKIYCVTQTVFQWQHDEFSIRHSWKDDFIVFFPFPSFSLALSMFTCDSFFPLKFSPVLERREGERNGGRERIIGSL